MLIAKLRRPFLIDLQFVPYEGAFMWVARTTWIGYTTPADFTSDFDFTTPSLNTTNLDIANVFVDNTPYELKTSIAFSQAKEGSFYFDIINQILYIHVFHDKRMDSSVFNALKVRAYCSGYMIYDDNDTELQPLLISGISINISADRLVYNKMGLVNNSLTFNNSDGEFDDFIDEPTPGADVNILYLSMENFKKGITTGEEFYTGFVSVDDYTTERNYLVSAQDKRAKLTADIPSTVFDSTTFPNIEDDLINEIIPEGYGDIKGAPGFCTNGQITTGNVNYKYATDGTSITNVYVKTDDAWNSVTPVSTSPLVGELVLSATDARDSSGNPKAVKVDARFRDLDNPGDILSDMIFRTFSDMFTVEKYNISEWNSEKAYLADVYLYMPEQKSFFEYAEELQNSSDYGFRFDIDKSGKYTLKVDDINRAISANYEYIDIMTNSIGIKRNFEEYATSVRVGYNYDKESGRGSAVFSDALEQQVFEKYRVLKQRRFSSNLTNATDAQNKADRIALDYSEARNQISFRIDSIVYHQMYDIITADTSRYIDAVKIEEFAGVRKLKLSGIRWNFSDETTELTGYDISDII